MSTARLFVQRRYSALMLLLIAGGFVMLLVELFLTGHTEGIQLVAVVASFVGLVLTLAALAANSHLRNLIALLFVVLSLSGVIGAYEHFEESERKEAVTGSPAVGTVDTGATFTVAYRYDEESEEEEDAGEVGEENPPPLAPLSLVGFGLMGAVATLGKREE